MTDIEDDELALRDSIDNNILMHRDVHFNGSFEVMCDYYRNEGKGVNPEFDLKRIHELAMLEKEKKYCAKIARQK